MTEGSTEQLGLQILDAVLGVNRKLTTMTVAMVSLKESVVLSSKRQQIALGSQRLGTYEAFPSYKVWEPNARIKIHVMDGISLEEGYLVYRDGESLIQAILQAFLKGEGYYLPEKAAIQQGTTELVSSEGEPSAKEKKAFREYLVEYLHGLIGFKPQLQKQEDGRWLLQI